MNAHLERFNLTIQKEFIDYHSFLLLNPDQFNRRLIDYLIFIIPSGSTALFKTNFHRYNYWRIAVAWDLCRWYG